MFLVSTLFLICFELSDSKTGFGLWDKNLVWEKLIKDLNFQYL